MNDKIKEILIIDEKTKELIALIPFNESENELILKKGLDFKISYSEEFKLKNENGKLVLDEEITEKFSEYKDKNKEVE
jgi:hypothetical protein